MSKRVLLSLSLVLALVPARSARAAQGPTRSPHGALGGECTDCHTPRRWIPVSPKPSFRHEKTGFPLEGAHIQTSCRSCHQDLVFNHVGTSCVDCHKDAHKGELGSRCEACHTPKTWTNQLEIFKVHNRTRLPLFAVHAAVSCDSCHKGQQPTEFVNTPATCAACHRQAAVQAKNPNHVLAGFSQQRCEECHLSVSRTWHQTTFKHPASFALKGAHASVKCQACHATSFKGTPRDCVGCHLPDYRRVTNPNHQAAGFPTQCSACHRETGWRPATFTDHSKTRFPLVGAHQRVDCTKCHAGGRYTGTSPDCASCHQADYQGTKNPAHAAAGIPTTCETCHTAAAWRPATFDHNKTRFPLTGAHRPLACARCHAGGKFNGASPACFSCHGPAFQAARNPSHTANHFPTTCGSCHTTLAWRPASFVDHNKTRFPLTGAHQAVDCAKCHVGAQLKGTPVDCVACHKASFQATKNPNHVAGNFSTQCTSCHTTIAWRPASFADHNKTRFPLTGAHQRVDCAKCHVGGKYTGTPTDCYSCHQANYKATTNPNHAAASFPTTCTSCHTTAAWRPATFDHARTKFPLAGAHQRVDCAKCHVGGKYTGTPTDCYSCHQANYKATTNPNHVAGSFPTTCTSCHTLNGWRPASFTDHSKTRFPLTGAHQRVDCAKCHVGGKYTGTPTDCYSCHQANYKATTNPNHSAARFPTTCTSCHTTAAWRPATFDHATTKFPLAGAHQRTDCAKCHVGGRFAGTPMDCYSCHQASYRATTNPNHVAGNFPITCNGCHTVNAWRPASFTDHNRTRFPLTGAHQRVDCAKCHVGGKYTGTPTDCFACHQANYRATTNPNHVAASFPTTCTSCHTTAAWRPATFDHARTNFPLAGAHQRVDCAKCHVGGRYAGTPMDCYACHQANYRATTNPNHVAANFPTTCTSCHTLNGWRPASFTDHSKTRFPLTGAHQRVDCALCHVGGRYTGTPTDCYACHQASYRGTQNPNHVAAGFPTTCTSCHTVNGWTPATFNHNATKFPLTGRHTTVTCTQCHVGGRYTGTPTDCYACHQASYRGTQNPNHVAAGFPTTCTSCHTVNGWTPATFNHNATKFPLTGRHTTVTCTQCHVGGRYTGTSTDCYACHQASYQGTKNPNHVAAGFPTTCTSCHTVNGWTPATFNHNATKFPLTGRHTTVTCAQCHVGGRYTGTSTDCYACHQANYQGTKNPNHVSAGFPTTCVTCHTTNGWTPAASFNHSTTKFPLTGRHVTVACTQCHVGGKYTGTSTDCYACHQANYQGTKNPNHVSAGFPTTCVTCHTTNGWTPAASFNHSTTKFPLTGRHVTVACTQCHVGGKYTGTSTDCYACHQANYQGTKNPNHVSAGFPTTCVTCHTTNGWTPATFNHTWFPQNHGSAQACSDCHTTASNYRAFECILCHEHSNKTSVDNKHKGRSGYAYTSAACYQCHPRGRS